jgi:UDP-GlcNAc3NAcA epimerase
MPGEQVSARRVLTILGARPQFVKAAAISRSIAAREDVGEILVHTGQHFDKGLSRIFFDELQIPEPSVNLGIHSGRHGEMTGRMLEALEHVMLSERPDLVLVLGDTTSTLAGALAAAKLLLCPTPTAVDNLRREGLVAGVHNIGDVMYDAVRFARANLHRSDVLDRLGIAGRVYAVATLHRAENTDDRNALSEIVAFLKEQAHDHPVVFPIHPRTRKRIEAWDIDLGRILACDPVGYLDMHRLLQSAITVFTDSGGLQKEAYFHRIPCVTLRSETEWVETVSAGWNRLWRGADYAPRREIADYGDGNAAAKAVELIVSYLAC